MTRVQEKPYPMRLKELMATKSRILTKARTCAEFGMEELATELWQRAATQEERLAPLLETLGRHREAALHRISAASCHQKAGDLSSAVNLFRAALAGPLVDKTRKEVEQFLANCLRELARIPVGARVPSGGS